MENSKDECGITYVPFVSKENVYNECNCNLIKRKEFEGHFQRNELFACCKLLFLLIVAVLFYLKV